MVANATEIAIVERTFDGKSIRQRKADGYFDASAMCRAAGKKWSHYAGNQATKDFLAELATDAGIPASVLIQVQKGVTQGNTRGDSQGTWIHPHAAIHLAQWCSPRFAVQVTKWVHDLMTTGRVEINPDPVPFAVLADKVASLERIIASLRPAQVTPAHPQATVWERCKWKGWQTTTRDLRAQIRRLANWLLKYRHGETPDVSGGPGSPCVYYAHQLAVLDEAIDRVREDYEREEQQAGPGLWD